MGFSEAVAWWDEWQVRVLALASLFLQCFLFIAAPRRKRGIQPWFRFLTWLAYLGSDAVAIYALAALFNHQRKLEWVSAHRSSASLQALWAPILLLHLGGQDSITAYNLEDNELWKRHVVTALSQITVAVYVFCKTWTGDKRLFQATIVIFVPGILKCVEKPWALYRASISSMADNLGRGDGGQGVEAGRHETTSPNSSVREEKVADVNSLHKYVDAAVKCVKHYGEGGPSGEVNGEPYKLFVDLSYSYQSRLHDLKYMVQKRAQAHSVVRSGLSSTFDRLYTKHQVYKTRQGNLTRIAVMYLTVAAIGLFHNCRREDYDRTDVKITYIFLCCTAALEVISTLRFKAAQVLGSEKTQAPTEPTTMVAQYNLIGYVARNTKHSWVSRLASLLHCKDYLDRRWTMAPCESSNDITERIHDYVTKGWKCYIKDAATYRSFNDNRGDWTLRRAKCKTDLEWSLRKPFDESVLLWHVATDFCFHHEEAGPPADEAIAHRCLKMSNYMAYLLFVNPEMLIPGARHGIFTSAYNTLHHILQQNQPGNGAVPTERTATSPGGQHHMAQQNPPSNNGAEPADRTATPPAAEQRELVRKIIQMLKSGKGNGSTAPPIHDAWALACELMKLGKKRKEKMWVVIQGVWVEMLCFSAGRCRGYLHAKSLGNGGEHLSYVWLLLCYMGMETMAERLRRTKPKHDEEGDIDAALAPGSSSAATIGYSAPAPGSSEPVTAATNADENV